MGQGFKVYSSSELYCKWPKVAETMTEADYSMDKIIQYRQIIRETLLAHSKIKPAYGEIEMEVLFDQERDRYQILRAGWLQKSRVYGILIHIDLKDNKVWIQYDGTEVGVANELLERGIPREDIVLAYHSPFMRQYDGFAVS